MEIDKLREEISKLRDLRAKYEEASSISKELGRLVDSQEYKLKEVFIELDMTTFEGVTLSTRASTKVPQTEADKAAFFGWLKDKGLYDTYVTVNSQSLNSLVKAEYDLARERGELDFSIPGLEISERTVLSVRKK